MKKNQPSESSLLDHHLNSIWLEGTLISEPEDGLTEVGHPLCRLQIASSRVLRQDEQTSVFDVEIHEPVLGACRKLLSKGRGVRIIGRLEQRRWRDRSGNPQSAVQIVSELVEPRPRFL